MASKASLEDLSGTAAVGSIGFLGLFLVVDSFLDLWSLLAQYTSSPTWGIVFAVPTLVLTYALGLTISGIADIGFRNFASRRVRDEMNTFLSVASLNNEAIVNQYNELLNRRSFFRSSCVSLIVLAIGLMLSKRWLPGYESFTYFMSGGCVLMAVLSPVLARSSDVGMQQIAAFAARNSLIVPD